MDRLAEISFKIISQILKVKEKQVISISSDILNASDSENPLNEIPFAEELSIAIRKRKAFPIWETSTENLRQRFFAEMSDEILAVEPNYYKDWIETIDAFIEIGWHSIENVYTQEEKSQLKKLKAPLYHLWQQILTQKKKLLFLNFPSRRLAKHLNKNFKFIRNSYLEAVNCNYNELELHCSRIYHKIINFNKHKITFPNQELTFKIQKDDTSIFNGTNNNIVILPTGKIEFILKKSSLNGTFIAERAYYKKSTYRNLKLNFENGDLMYVSFENERSDNFTLKNALLNTQEECSISMGLNPQIMEFTNYYSYDRCIDGLLALKFLDSTNNQIILANKNAEIK